MKNAVFFCRSFLSLILVLVFCSAVGFGADWPAFRGPNGNGIIDGENWNPNFADPKPEFLWRANIGIGFSVITVSHGRAYTTGNLNNNDVVFCFDAETGEVLWRHNYPEPKDPKYYEGGTSASVTIDSGKAYVLSRTGDAFCLEAEKGTVLWEKNFQEEYGYEPPTWGFAGSPYIMDEMVVYNVGSRGAALNKDTGALIWKSPASVSGYSTPVPFEQDGKVNLLLFCKDSLDAVDPKTGSVQWTFPWKTKHNVNAADPIVLGNRIFISSGYNHGCSLLEVNGSDVKQLWESREMRNHFSSCVLHEGYLYGFDESTLKCLEFNTGQVKWQQGGLGKGTLIMADDILIVLAESGQLVTAPASPGGFEPISKAKILSGARCWSMPVLANGKIFARNADGDAVCVDVSNGDSEQAAGNVKNSSNYNWCQWRGPGRDGVSKETGLLKEWPAGGPEMIWSYEGIGKGYASPSICDGVIYVPGTIEDKGYLYAIDLDGKLKWETVYGTEWVRSFPGSRSTPAVRDGKVYIITGLGEVVCCDASNGKILWSQDVKSKYDGEHRNWGYAVSPLVFDDKVVFSPGGDKAVVVALDNNTGSVLWESSATGEDDAYCPPLVFEHGGKKMLVTMMADSVWFLDANTGKLVYRDKFEDYQKKPKDVNPNTPIYHNGCVFTTSGYDSGSAMYEISPDGSSIKRKWVDTELDTHHGGTVLLDGKIYGANWKGNNNGDWVCLDWETGKVLSSTHWENKGSILAADDMLYLYEEKNGHVALARPKKDGLDIVSSFQVSLGEDQHWAHPVVCNKRLYIRHGSVLMAFDVSSK